MSNIIDRLINEIAVLVGLSPEEVKTKFTQEQLDNLLASSKCEEVNAGPPIETNLEDISCKDDGSPSDLVTKLKQIGNFPNGLVDAQTSSLADNIKSKKKDPLFDGSECIDAVQEVNKKVKEITDSHTDHNILLNRLYELRDHLIPLKYYYDERAKRLGQILGEFRPILAEMKRLRDEIIRHTDILIPEQDNIITSENKKPVPNKSVIDAATIRRDELIETRNQYQLDYTNQESLRNGEEDKYPLMTNNFITGYSKREQNTYSRQMLISEIKSTISNDVIYQIDSGLAGYSEYITIDIFEPSGTYSEILQNPMIGFNIKFQDRDVMYLDKEKFDIQTGNKSVYKHPYKIKESPLLLTNIFFLPVPGYVISNVPANKYFNSRGALYENYYNLLKDPQNNFFTLDERGLTSNASLLDKNLIGKESFTKKENNKNYFISNLSRMQDFYKNFDLLWENKRKQIRENLIGENLSTAKSKLELVAKYDVELLLALGRVNVFNPDSTYEYTITNTDGTTSSINSGQYSDSQTVIDSINNANLAFIQRLAALDSEIARIEEIVKNKKLTPEKVKGMLKSENSKCFDKMSDVDEESPCSDVNSKLGSDPYFESLDGIDPTLPNFSQGCYWKEFTKLVNFQGLCPIPNSPNELRYWPVGLIIPTPGGLIKIPLPQIWNQLVTISTPSGVLVTFLNINGIFISPVVFFLSASGYKQHLVTVRGSSDKFGSDKNDELIKPTIKVPLITQASLDVAKAGDISVEGNLTKKEAAQIELLNKKKKEADVDGDSVRSHKAKKEIKGIRTQVSNRVTPDTEKMKKSISKGENASDEVENIKKSIFKVMDDLGKPSLNRINKLKEKSAKREAKLKAEKLEAMKNGDKKRVNEINKKLKTDGLDINDKIKAYKDDMNDYFDAIVFPKSVIPKEVDKLNPKPDSGEDEQADRAIEMTSKLQDDFVSDDSVKVNRMFGVGLAKYKDELEAKIPSGTLNIDENTEEIKKHMKTIVDDTASKIKGDGSKPIDIKSTNNKLKTALDNKKKAKTPKDKKKADKEYEDIQKSTSKKMEQDRTKQTLSITTGLIATLSGVNVSMDPFAKCCQKSSFNLGYPLPSLVGIAILQGGSMIKDLIDKMSPANLKQLMGGKSNVSAKDMRLGVLSAAKSAIPNSLSIPKPKLNLKASADMFNGIIRGLSMPQASLPEPLSLDQLSSKITIDTTIVKGTIKASLNAYLDSNLLNKNSQDLESSFMHSNPNDIKTFMKQFIESMSDPIEKLISGYYKIINSKKSGNGIELTSLEKKVFNSPPFGSTAKSIFISKSKVKMNLSKAASTFVISETALAAASKILKTSLSPIVSNPTAYMTAASAGVSNTTDVIRKIHPILNADDIPPWERMSSKNILYLLFLDEFVSVGADQVGFFRQYL